MLRLIHRAPNSVTIPFVWSILGTALWLLPLGGCGSGGAAAPAVSAVETEFNASASVTAGGECQRSAVPATSDVGPADHDRESDEDLAEEVDDPSEEPLVIAELEQGSPEWIIREIARLRATPPDVVRQPVAGQPAQVEQFRLPDEQVETEQRRRAEQTIQLATEAIAKTHRNKESEQLFNHAVHYLTEARAELALAGYAEQSQLLSDDAEALYQRDATSFAAMTAALKLVQLTQLQAQQSGDDDPQWVQAFARQARLFAEKFPQETHRAALNLMAAGRMCDEMNLHQDALACLEVVEQKFPETPFAEHVAGMLRRLRLPGERLVEFGGSTFDGGFVNLDQFRGGPVVIVFWASNSAKFRAGPAGPSVGRSETPCSRQRRRS